MNFNFYLCCRNFSISLVLNIIIITTISRLIVGWVAMAYRWYMYSWHVAIFSFTGGTVNHSHKGFRLNGVLATTRGLGNHGDRLLKKCVIKQPFTASISVDKFCQFLILASNGVWQVLSEEEAAVLLLEVKERDHFSVMICYSQLGQVTVTEISPLSDTLPCYNRRSSFVFVYKF